LKAHEVLAMPQLIPQNELNQSFVRKWRSLAEKALIQKPNMPWFQMLDSEDHIFLFKRNASSGVFFVSNDHKKVEYIHVYENVTVKGHRKAAEALLYNFGATTKKLSDEIFFEWMLPEFKFIVTDGTYTPSGQSWFVHQYAQAFARGLKVWLIDLAKDISKQIDKEYFDTYQFVHWGSEENFQKIRFAISY